MSSSGGYPLGADQDPRAPWKRDTTETSVDVTVSITYSKSLAVKVPKDHDYPDLCNAAQEEIWEELSSLSKKGWIEDEFEVVEE